MLAGVPVIVVSANVVVEMAELVLLKFATPRLATVVASVVTTVVALVVASVARAVVVVASD